MNAIEPTGASTATPAASPASGSRGAAPSSSTARRRPSARCAVTASTSAVSAAEKGSRSAPRRSDSAPHVAWSSTSTARSSSPKPCGPMISRWRSLRSRTPPVAWLRVAAWRSDRTSEGSALKSSPPNSISFSRGYVAGGGTFSATMPVGISVAGSIVPTNTPSNDTARARIRTALSAKSRTSAPRCTSRTRSSRTRAGGVTTGLTPPMTYRSLGRFPRGRRCTQPRTVALKFATPVQ